MEKYFPDISHIFDSLDTKTLPTALVLSLLSPLQRWLGQTDLEKHLY